MTFQTSNAGKALIKEFETCKLEAYADKQSGAPVIGWGQENALFPGTPGEIRVRMGLTITQQQADDGFDYFVHNIVDPLVRKHFNCDTQEEHDACASWIFNMRMARLERGEYTLPSVFNKKPRDFPEVVYWWIKYRNPGTIMEKGLYRRRLAELCLMRGWPYRHAWAATLESDPWVVLSVAEQQAKTENEITADLNNAQLEKLGGKVGQKVATPRPPPVDPELPPKKMEDSRTYKAVSRADRGKETAIIGTLTGTGVTAAAANAERVGTLIEKFKPETFFIMAGMIGVFLVVMGLIMWWSGRNEAYHRRQHTQDPKY